MNGKQLRELSNRIYQRLGLVRRHDDALTMSTQTALDDVQNTSRWQPRYANFEPAYYGRLDERYTLAVIEALSAEKY